MTAVTVGPRYAPEDPTLPKPWKGLVDGKTGYLYFWNPETNITQYERPAAPSVKGLDPPQKSISSSVQVQQSSHGPRRENGFVDDGDRYGRGSNGGSKLASEEKTYQINDQYGRHIQNEIKTAVKQVCNTYNLPLGVTWVSSKGILLYKPQVSFQGELLVANPEMSYLRDSWISDNCVWTTPLRVNQGFVGKVFSSGNIHFCKDVCQLSISEYPLIPLARKLGIASSFAVCLRNISTGNHEFVIDFSLFREMTHNLDIQGHFPSILATIKRQFKSFEVVTGDIEIEKFTEFHNQSEESNNDLTSYMAISTPTTSEGDSMQSLGTTECSMNSTCRQPVWPSRKRVNESNLFIPESSFPVNRSAQRAESESNGWGNSETASTKWVKLFGYTISANQLDVPILNQSRRTMSLHSGAPLSEASAIHATLEMITDVELLTIKVRYREDIIKFDLPLSSSYANLRENIVTRWCFLKEKAFAIKYLNDFSALISLATDKDLQECMAWTRSKGIKLSRMLIQMEDDVQGIP